MLADMFKSYHTRCPQELRQRQRAKDREFPQLLSPLEEVLSRPTARSSCGGTGTEMIELVSRALQARSFMEQGV